MATDWQEATRIRLEEARRIIANETRNAMSRIAHETNRILGEVIDMASDALDDVDQTIPEE